MLDAITKKGGRRKDDHATSMAERDWAANALSIAGPCRSKLAELVFEFGKDLRNSVKDFVACGNSSYGATVDHFFGR